MDKIEEKVAFITGGASGIGLGMAKVFVRAGMKVVMADIRQDHLDKAKAYFTGAREARNVHGVHLDVTDRAEFQCAADEAEVVFGKINVLVNNAGMSVRGPLKQTGYDDWDWGLGVMIGGVINGIQTILPRILDHGEGGHIVNTSSMAALVPVTGLAIYGTAKMAMIGLSEAIRGELAADNIGVSVFCPGPVQTNIRESWRTRPEKYRRNSGFSEIERRIEERPNSPLWMDPVECGERVLAGILRNDLYILTHREFREGAAEHFRAILDAFPDEPINEARAGAIRYLLSNPIFQEGKRSKEPQLMN
jgi:NADP-dependent 3-hydroxy acid dehydrogenase YdfG